MRPPANESTSAFGLDITNLQSNPAYMICQRLAGRGIVRVVGRCEDAQENKNLGRPENMEPYEKPGQECTLLREQLTRLDRRISAKIMTTIQRISDDLSECQLMSVPDAVYHLMRHTEVKCCNLSSNVISKITPKFAVKFSLITELNLAHNQMDKLPDELSDLEKLEKLNISHNSFIALPNVVFKIPQLKTLHAQHNHIVDVEVERILSAPSIEEIDLQENPLTPRCHDSISALSMLRIKITPRQKEDWEDLTI